MEANIKERGQELERVSNVTGIEAASLKLSVSESKAFKIKDHQAYQRIKVRFTRLKSETGRCYTISMDGNNVIVTRNEDIVQ
jgi:hypothetical protein